MTKKVKVKKRKGEKSEIRHLPSYDGQTIRHYDHYIHDDQDD